MTDWNKVKMEYVRSDLSLPQIAKKFGLAVGTVQSKSCAGLWSVERQKYRQRLQETISDKVVETDAQEKIDRLGRIADTADRLLRKIEIALDQLDDRTVVRSKKVKTARKGKDDGGSFTETVTEEREDIDVVKAPIDRLGVRQLSASLRDLHDIARGVVDGDVGEVGVVVLTPVKEEGDSD